MNELSFRGATSTMGTAPPPSMREEAWILGQPPTDSYLDFVEELAVGTTLSKRELVDEWRAANDHYFELEQTEAGAADKIGCRALPSVLAPLAAELKADLKENDAAREELNLALMGLGESGGDSRLNAEAAGLDGELWARDNNFAEAARAYDREAGAWRKSRNYEALSAALARAGAAYRRAGQEGLAADRFFRAARSRLNSGAAESAEVRDWQQQARECAEKAGRSDLVERME